MKHGCLPRGPQAAQSGRGDLRGKLTKEHFALVKVTEVPKELLTVGYPYSYLLH